MSAAGLEVIGPAVLRGEVEISGFKHLLVTSVAAAMLTDQPVSLANCPDILETSILADLLRSVGGRVSLVGRRLELALGDVDSAALDPRLCQLIHGAVYLLPGLLSRFGEVHMPWTGGCRIGDRADGGRPTSQYVDVLRRFGAQVSESATGMHARAGSLQGCTIDLRDYTSDRQARTGPLYSGATKMAILAAVAAHGVTRLLHPYPKPDVTELVALLEAMGAAITAPHADEIVVDGHGASVLNRSVEYSLPADLIELVTWVAIAALTGCALRISAPRLDTALRGLAPELRVLRAMGVDVTAGSAGLDVSRRHALSPVQVTVASHEVFSDSQPMLCVLATHASGRSIIHERVWSRRFGYVQGLRQLGARLAQENDRLVVDGPCAPSRPDQEVLATDLRSASALLIAALGVPGRTVVRGSHHLARGYPDLPGTLSRLGARVEQVDTVSAGRG